MNLSSMLRSALLIFVVVPCTSKLPVKVSPTNVGEAPVTKL